MSDTNPSIVAETITATGNAKVNHNLIVGGQISAVGTISSNNANITGVTGVVTLHASSISSRGPVSGNALKTVGIVTAAGNIIGGNILTAGLISASANITGRNLKVLGNVVITGDVDTIANITTPVGSITGNSLTALTALQLPVYDDENARDRAISKPTIGMLVVVGNTFQGYANGDWGNLTLS